MSRRSDRFRTAVEDKAFDVANQALEGATREQRAPRGGIVEKRWEWLTWGLSVVVLGVSIVVGGEKPFAGSNHALWLVFPALAGGAMLGSAVLQKIINNWNVSLFTWSLGTILSALAVERFYAIFIAPIPAVEPFWPFNAVVFFGALVIITGLLILLQIFRRA